MKNHCFKKLYPKNKTEVLVEASKMMDKQISKINETAIQNLKIKKEEIKVKVNPITIQDNLLDEHIKKTIVLNSINYQFWDIDKKGLFVRYQHMGKTGALAMQEAFSKNWNGIFQDVLNGKTILDGKKIKEIFGDIPDIENRVIILNSVLEKEKLEFIFKQIKKGIRQEEKLDVFHANIIANTFDLAYGDELLKKAQLAVYQCSVFAMSAGYDLEVELTAFADYQIPSVLRHLGVLEYSKSLGEKIDNSELIEANGDEEKAIRGSSLIAMELIAKYFDVSVADLDFYIWQLRNESKKPFHLTKTTKY